MSDSMDLSIEDVKQISVLTRISMTEDELNVMRTQMKNILDITMMVNYMNKL